jgi:arginine-tRNA-protein transferase
MRDTGREHTFTSLICELPAVLNTLSGMTSITACNRTSAYNGYFRIYSLEASKFKPAKSQRSILNRFNTFIRDGGHEGEPGYGPPEASTSVSAQASVMTPEDSDEQQISLGKDKKGKGKAKLKGKHTQPFDLFTAIHAAETKYSGADTKHRFEVTMEPAAFSEEKYDLYKRYQMEIHGDKESKVTEDGFRRFLCDSPLEVGSYSLPATT